MSAPGALSVQGFGEWMQLVFGLLLFLAPGLAAVDRLTGLRNRGWWFAPVFSFTLLPLGAILLDMVLQVRITVGVTVGLAVAWTLLLEMPRLRKMRIPKRSSWIALQEKVGAMRAPRWTGFAFLLVLSFVFLVQSLPHWPGDDASALTAYPGLAERVVDAAGGEQFPYPIHVDEHYHLAQQAAIERQGTIDIEDPYTAEPPPSPLFSVSGFRQERGFDLALVQLHDLTGMDLMAQARLLPAFQVTLLAALTYATLAPARGAWISALFIAIIPTTVRFLGPGFLVPSAFALPWVMTSLHVSLRGQGGRRLAALALLETGAFFLHLVLGTLVLVVAALATLARKDRGRDRLVLLAVCFLPLVWIGPVVAEQVTEAVVGEHDLSFQPGILYKAGFPMLFAAIGGAILAFLPHRDEGAPMRVLAVLGTAIVVSLGLSIQFDHRSDATYSRLIPTFFVCVAGLAGWAVGWVCDRVARSLRAPASAVPLGVLLGLAFLMPAVHFALDAPYYRVFDEGSWRDGRTLASTDITDQDVFLSDPWRAPVYNSLTGALPHAVLIPGRPPENGADWGYYLSSGGANEQWFSERGITYVVAPVRPNAPHEHVAGNVYRIISNPGAT